MKVNYQNLTVTVFNGLYRGIGQSFIHTLRELNRLGVDPYLIRMTAEKDSADYASQIYREYGVKINPVEGFWKWVDCCNMERHTPYAPFDSFISGGPVHTWDNVPAKTRSPQLVTVHDTFLFAKKYKKLKAKFEYLDEEPISWFMKYVDRVACPSQFSADDFREEFPAFSGEVDIIPWGSKFEFVNTGKILKCGEWVEDTVRPNLIPDGEYFLYVSAPEARKNFTTIVQAFEKSTTDKKLVVVADISIISPDDRDKVAPLLKSNRIHFLGKVNEAELKRLYEGAEALVMTSALEGFGMPVVEAASLGCPVICSNTSSMKEFSFATQINPASMDDHVDIFNSFSKRSLETCQKVSSGFHQCKSTYNYKKAAERYFGIYKEIGG